MDNRKPIEPADDTPQRQAAELAPDVLPAALLARLANALNVEEPDPEIRSRLRQTLMRRARESTMAGRSRPTTVTVPPGDDGWSPHVPGIDRKVLMASRQSMSILLRMEPDAVLPAHDHDGPEECVVLEGAVMLDGRQMVAGTFHAVSQGVRHQDIRAIGKAVLYLRIAAAPASPAT